MTIAVDFSTARPSIATLKANHVVIVIRYLTGSAGKAITFAELNTYLTAGIAVAFVFEIRADDATGGFAAGAANARQAIAAMSAMGITGCPIYFAVDQSIDPSAAEQYFVGINSVLQPTFVGIYGEGALCSLLQTEGLACWFWQSESTSFPGNAVTLPITHLQQKFDASPVPDTDLDVICKPDVGQYPRPAPLPQPTEEQIMQAIIINGVPVVYAASPDGHLFEFTKKITGWSVDDVTAEIAKTAAPGTPPFLVA